MKICDPTGKKSAKKITVPGSITAVDSKVSIPPVTKTLWYN